MKDKKDDKKKAKLGLMAKIKSLLTKKNPNREKMEQSGFKVNPLEPRK